MNDNIDNLSDEELSEVFAVEVAGFVKTHYPGHSTAHGSPQVWWDEKKQRCLISEPYSLSIYGHTRFNHSWKAADFATSADAVLPFLETWYVEAGNLLTSGWLILVRKNSAAKEYWRATSPTFARAAAIALVRAKRSTKDSPC